MMPMPAPSDRRSVRFVTKSAVARIFQGKRVAIVGSGPSVLHNKSGFIDGHDLVVRVNNYKLSEQAGKRADVFYSFFGESIRKNARDLQNDGVTLCMCKCPDAQFIDSQWHERRRKMNGVDFRYIYRNRRDWWFCDTYIPSREEFVETFDLLGRHVPTTGFSAILTVLQCAPAHVYLTGFDFFRSGIHNVDEKWRRRNPEDPIGHEPERERLWLMENRRKHPLSFDPHLRALLNV